MFYSEQAACGTVKYLINNLVTEQIDVVDEEDPAIGPL